MENSEAYTFSPAGIESESARKLSPLELYSTISEDAWDTVSRHYSNATGDTLDHHDAKTALIIDDNYINDNPYNSRRSSTPSRYLDDILDILTSRYDIDSDLLVSLLITMSVRQIAEKNMSLEQIVKSIPDPDKLKSLYAQLLNISSKSTPERECDQL